MSQWYISKNGQATGPFEDQTIIDLIKKNELNHLDLIFKVGESDWLPLSQRSEFMTALGGAKDSRQQPTVAGEGADWVLLKKVKSAKGSEFKQLGPFTTEQVVQLIDQGEIRFSDFAWKKQFPTWVKISDLEEFDKPLPSSPHIDPTIYEKTNTGLDIETLTHVEKKKLINDFKKPKKSIESEIIKGVKEAASSDPEATRVVHTLSIPLNTQDFATESKKVSSISESEDLELWSLENRSKKAKRSSSKSSFNIESTKVVSIKNQQNSKRRTSLSSSIQPYLLGTVALILSGYFLFLSLAPHEDSIEYDRQLAQAIQEQPEKPKVLPPSIARVPSVESEETEVAQTEPSLDIKPEDLSIEERAKVFSQKMAEVKDQAQSIDEKTVEAVVSEVAAVKRREPASASKKPLSKSIVVSAPVTKKINASKPYEIATGSSKAQSYYKQRDRKALFYSSLKAETLAVDIEKAFQKMKGNKKLWRQFYSNWKKRVRTSLASEIQTFPESSNKYAYPKVIESFKKDYELFYKYGEVFNARVTGGRLPADAPTELKSVFARYREQSKKL